MEDLQIFKNEEFGQVRGMLIDNEPWFVGKDVASTLGYENQNRDIISHVDEDDRIMLDKTQYENGIEFDYRQLGQRGGWIINESGLYSLILSSRLPNAKQFKKWVTSEVLPSIRKTGGYILTTQEDDEETIMAKAFLIAQRTIEKKNKLIEEMTPRVNWFDKFMSSEGLYTSTQVAKVLHISSAKKLNTILNEEKIIYRQGKSWLPYVSTDKSWYKLIVGSSENYSYSQLKFTPKGIYEISKILDVNLKEEDVQSV